METTFGPFELKEETRSAPGFVVWKAWDPSLEREICVRAQVMADGLTPIQAVAESERFLQRARRAAALNHPSIVTVFDTGFFDGRAAVVSECVKGASLSTLLERGLLPVELHFAVVDGVLEALEHAHSQGVAHGDIKPDNIYVSEDGRLKLGDFGEVSALPDPLTGLNGSQYQAPEQVGGAEPSPRSDLFSVAVVAYQMLTGVHPFMKPGETHTASIIYRLVNEEPVDVLTLNPALPMAMVEAVRAGLRKDPRERPVDAATMRRVWRRDAELAVEAVAPPAKASAPASGPAAAEEREAEAATSGADAPAPPGEPDDPPSAEGGGAEADQAAAESPEDEEAPGAE